MGKQFKGDDDMAEKKKMGAPRKEVDFKTVDTLCAFHCTGEEIAYFCKVNYDTLNARVKEQEKPDGTKYAGFSEYFAVKSSKGRISLRKLQWASANRGNIPMQIFLGKNLLNQTDKQQMEMRGETEIRIGFDDDEEWVDDTTDSPE